MTLTNLAAGGAVSVVIRRAEVSDIQFLVALENAAFASDLLSKRSFKELIGSMSADVWIAERLGAPLGYAVVLYRAKASIGRVYSIAVDRTSARSGIGSLLLEAAEMACGKRGLSRVRLEVDENNLSAISVYKRFGYQMVGRTEKYYENGAAALRFEKRLTKRSLWRTRA